LRKLAVLVAILGLYAAARPAGAQPIDPTPLITQRIDETSLVSLPGNTRPEAVAANDLGPVEATLPLEHIEMQLRRSPAAEKLVADFVAAQHDRASPLYHQWLTADEFGARFGLGQADLDTITSWLAAHGFTVNAVLPSRMVIDFSGNAGQVAEAFHTEIHQLRVGGVTHIANMSDPEIPAALAPAVTGLVSLHDFSAHSYMKPVRPGVRPKPDATGSGGAYPLVPGDLATIYNFNAAFKAGITGKGQTIALVEPTDLFSNKDWTNFRTTFGLSSYTTGTFSVVHPSAGKLSCTDPKVTSADDEATLDVEWASAAAPGAAILMVSCAETKTTDGTYLASQIEVNAAKPAHIISVSYGICETVDGATMNAAFASLWQQAASEGISVYVATGDNGPDDCATNGATGASQGITANGWATTAYNVAVGGTDFEDTYLGTNATYWAATNSKTYASAKSYIPEIPWNSNCGSTLFTAYFGFKTSYGSTGFCNSSAGSGYTGLGGGEGAPSACATGTPKTAGLVGGTCKGTPKPSWQSALNVPQDSVRDIPDVSLFAANGAWNHYYIFCYSDPAPGRGGVACTESPLGWSGSGGTSFATPIWAGIQALINEKVGTAQGNPAPTLYSLATTEYGTASLTACNSTKGNAIGGTCIFNNVTVGDDNSDCVKGTPNCYTPSGTLGVLSTSTTAYKPAYLAGSGYNFPTGLGTVNVTNLVNGWPK
jgi:subtilase family serine protease